MKEYEYKLKQAREFEERGQNLHALQIYLALLEIEESKRTATVRLSVIYEKMNRDDKVRELMNSYIASNPDDEDVIKFFAHYMLRREEYDEALKILSGVSTENNPEVFYILGVANYKLKELRTAEINFRSFINTIPGSELVPESNLYLSKIFLEKGDSDKALEYAKRSENFLSQNHEVHLLQAKILFSKEMYFHALESINRALTLNDSDCMVYKWAGKIFIKLGEYKRAEQYLTEFISVCQPDVETYLMLGMAYHGNNKNREALNCFNKALKIDPANEDALKNIAKINSK